jgi:hypothetical protein
LDWRRYYGCTEKEWKVEMKSVEGAKEKSERGKGKE